MYGLRYLPNAITILRFLAMGPLVYFMLEKRYDAALLVALFAAISDGLDGFLAKRFGWTGWLGSVLDPLADKFMMLCCYAVLTWQGHVPVWLTTLVILRDVVIIAGATLYHFTIGRVKHAQPTFLSKLNTTLQFIFVLTLLLNLAGWVDLPGELIQALMWLVAITTLLSGIQYVWTWGRKAVHTKTGKAISGAIND